MKTGVSVVLTTFNRYDLFVRALCSAQRAIELVNISAEVIIVDDCSEESISLKIKELIKDSEIMSYYRNNTNKGLSSSRNIGWANAQYELVTFLDDDDYLLPNSIADRLEAYTQLNSENTILHAGWSYKHVTSGRVVRNSANMVSGNIREFILNNWLETHSGSVLYTRKILTQVGGFDEAITSSVDHDIWFKFAEINLEAQFLDVPTVESEYFSDRQSMVNDTYRRIEGIEGFIEKWGPIMTEWTNQKRSIGYFRNYRLTVFIPLLVNKILLGVDNEAHYIWKYLKSTVNPATLRIRFVRAFVFKTLWRLAPKKILDFLRKR